MKLNHLIVFLMNLTYALGTDFKFKLREKRTVLAPIISEIKIPTQNETKIETPPHQPKLLVNLDEIINSKIANDSKILNDTTNRNVNNLTRTNVTTVVVNTPHTIVNNLPKNPSKDDMLQSGALLRGFYVLLGITLILIMYLGFRMFRLRKGSRPAVMVRKYGVLTNRGDVEMEPLPLSDDEDDDTVFELNDHVNR